MKRMDWKLYVSMLAMVSLLVLMSGRMTTYAVGEEQQPFSIVIFKKDALLFEKEYSLKELLGLPQTRQRYTSMNDDDSPELILAEGVLFSDLLKNLGLTQKDLKSIRIYSAEGWNRGFVPKFLLGSTRYFYPSFIKQAKPEWEQPAPEDPPVPFGGDIVNPDTDGEPAVTVKTPEENEVEVTPILALKTYQSLAADGEDWSKLQSNDGIRICYGQLNPSDVCSTLYGSNLNRIEFTLTEKSSYGLPEGEQPLQVEDGVVVTVDRYNDKKVHGSATDPDTNVTIEEIPSELTIRVGYFGYEYQVLKTVTIDDLKKLPIVKQAYTVRQGNRLIVESVMGVRLVDLLAAAGIYQNQVRYFYFYTADSGPEPKLEISKKALMNIPRFYYPKLPTRWEGTTGMPRSGAAVNAVKVDPVLTFRDHWDAGATAPNFYSMDGTNRFRLALGQMTTRDENGAQWVKWLHTIDVMLSGAPPTVGNDGTGMAGAPITRGGSGETATHPEQNTVPKPSEQPVPEEPVTQGDTENPDGFSRKWHLYEVTNLESSSVEREDETACLPLMSGAILLIAFSGAAGRYWQYKKELEEL